MSSPPSQTHPCQHSCLSMGVFLKCLIRSVGQKGRWSFHHANGQTLHWGAVILLGWSDQDTLRWTNAPENILGSLDHWSPAAFMELAWPQGTAGHRHSLWCLAEFLTSIKKKKGGNSFPINGLLKITSHINMLSPLKKRGVFSGYKVFRLKVRTFSPLGGKKGEVPHLVC